MINVESMVMGLHDRISDCMIKQTVHLFEDKRQTILAGSGAVNQVNSYAHGKKPMCVIDRAIKDSSFVRTITSQLYYASEYYGFTSNPDYRDIKVGISLYKDAKCDSIIAIGGGSAIDVAKCIKLLAGLDGREDYQKQEFIDSHIPLIAIPTTAGTGSESTRFAVIYRDGVKQNITNTSIIPDVAILDPDVLSTLPDYQKKCTLLDALCQGIESWWSVRSTSDSKALAKSAIVGILSNIDCYLTNEPDAAEAMMIAANQAGQAINVTQTTAPHAFSYKSSSMYKIPHGHAVAICLPHIWHYMLSHIDSCADPRGQDYLSCVFIEIAKALGGGTVLEGISIFEQLLTKLGVPTPSGWKQSDIEILAESVNGERLANSPVPISKDDIKCLYINILSHETYNLFNVFKEKVLNVHDFFTGVPDSLLSPLCNWLVSTIGINEHHIVAANEGNCVGIAAGYHLATGKVPVIYLQNSGIGNIINPITSLLHPEVYCIPCVFIVGWRGEPGVYDEPQHIYMGEVSKQLLEDVGIHTAVLDATTDERTLNGVIAEFDNYLTHGEGVAYIVRKDAFRSSDKIKYTNRYTLNREDAIRAIVNAAGDDIIISATGKASRELYEIREENGQSHDPDFLTVGSMGHSSSIALGIALNQPKKRVWCIDGDGAVLMHMGAMAVIGANQPKNLRHVIINNTAHESVGGVPTVAGSIDIAQIAVGCGYKNVLSVNDNDSLVDALKELHDTASLSLLEVKCSISSRTDLGRPKERAVENKEAFIRFVGL